MVRSLRYSPDLTVRIIVSTMPSHGCAARVETLDGGEILYRTDPIGTEQGARADAYRWIRRQPGIRTADGCWHPAPSRRFVGRRGSGRGYYVYVYGGEVVSAALAIEDDQGRWIEAEPARVDHIPEAALATLGVVSR